MRAPALVLILALLSLSAYGLSEHPVTEPVYGQAPGWRALPAATSDGENYLAAWYDSRTFPNAVYAARLDRRGNVLDRTGIRLREGFGEPRVVFAGQAYVVLWVSSGAEPQLLWTARINREGEIIDGPRAVAGDLPGNSFQAATNGRRIVIRWSDRLYVLDAEARLLERDIAVPASETPLLASNGSTFATATAQQVVALDTNGHPVGAANLAAGLTPSALASDGDSFLLAGRDAAFNAISVRVSAAGIPQPPVSLSPVIDGSGRFQLLWTGSAYLLTREATSLARLDREGKFAGGPFGLAGHGYVSYNAMASNGERALFVQTIDEPGIGTPLKAFTLDPKTFLRGDEVLVSQSARYESTPSIAFSGRGYGVAWGEYGAIRFARLGLGGRTIDAEGIDVMTGNVTSPRVVFDGRNFVVAWLASSDYFVQGAVHMARIDPDTGTVLDPGGVLAVSTKTDFFDLASNGVETVIVSTDWTPLWDEPVALRVTRVNRLAQRELAIIASPATMRTAAPRLAWNGTEWLLAFQEMIVVGYTPDSVSYQVNLRAVRMTPDFFVRDAAPLPVAVKIDKSESDLYPVVASNGADFVIAWLRFNASTGTEAFFARRVGADGVLGPVQPMSGKGQPLTMAWDGSRYGMVRTASSGYGWDYRLSYLDSSAHPLGDDAPFALAASPNAAIVNGDRGLVTAYARLSLERRYGAVSRVFVATPFTPAPRARVVRPR
jgi:hypothetical protein